MHHDPGSEQAVLCAMLMDGGAALEAADLLRPTDFGEARHGLIFSEAVALAQNGGIEVITLRNRLVETGKIERAGGTDYLADLLEVVPTHANLPHHAEIVRRYATRRQLRAAGQRIGEIANDGAVAADELHDRAMAELLGARDSRTDGRLRKAAEMVVDAWNRIDAASQNQGVLTGVSTGIEALDDLTTGLQPGDLCVIAAATSIGKTALAAHTTRINARQQRACVVFSLEMATGEMLHRMLCAEADVDAQCARRGQADKNQRGKLFQAADLLQHTPLWIDDSAVQTVASIRTRVRRLQAEVEIALVVVDYLNLVTPMRERDVREQEVSSISRGLKQIAQDLRVPILALAQLNRRANEAGRPHLSHLRESGAIGQDANAVVLLSRSQKEQDVLILDLAKQRNGPTGEVRVHFDRATGRFRPLTRREI